MRSALLNGFRPAPLVIALVLFASGAVTACGDPNATTGSGRGSDKSMDPELGPDGKPIDDDLIGPDGQPVNGGAGGGANPDDIDVDDTDPDVLGPDGQPVDDTDPPGGDPGTVVDVVDLPDDAEPVTSNDVFLSSRVRRLTNVEYANTIADLFEITVDVARLPADTRQNDFTRNVAQAVDPVLGGHLQSIAEEVAAQVVQSKLGELGACATTSADEACAQSIIEEFGQRVYRRPLEATEVASLLELYAAGAEGQSNPFPAGIEIVLQAMLQSGSFLYVSEMGQAGAGNDLVLLTPWELAASLSYLLTAHPPDPELTELARDSSILEPAVRRAQAERLLSTPSAELQIRRFVKEWLKLDGLATVDKADPRFATLRGPMEAEADAFISAIAINGDGRLSTLLTAGYTFVGSELADFYGVSPDATGRASLDGTGRLGLLQLGSFLAANSQNDESGPIKRGVAVLRKVLCYDLPDPSTVDNPEVMNVMPPARDETLTTRERFAEHSTSDACVGCHSLIDPIGFSFENFDAIGQRRAMDANKPVDTSGGLYLGTTVDGEVEDSVELSRKLAQAPRVAECFARHVYRYGAANNDAAAENTFIRSIASGGTVTDEVRALLIALSGGNSFLLRRVPTADEQL